ncbi:MAG: hypothetical protein GC129_05100 [Proteobacteria bacterium]|nr:hypothetical protein [Pseudomonadota bacterium]
MVAAFRSVLQLFAASLRRLWGLLLPPSCISCHAYLPATEPTGFCPSCYANLPWWNTSHVLKPPLLAALTSFAAPCLYQGPLRHALLRFKFQDHTHLSTPLAKLLVPLVPNTPNLLIIPVPSHPTRLRARRYNHAALLAQKLAEITHLPVHLTALKRLRKAIPQNRKTRAQRLQLPGTHFSATSAVSGRPVLLIDDIFTTGATAKACALALRRAGATQVHTLTLAYTKPE